MAYKCGLLTTYKSWDDPPTMETTVLDLRVNKRSVPCVVFDILTSWMCVCEREEISQDCYCFTLKRNTSPRYQETLVYITPDNQNFSVEMCLLHNILKPWFSSIKRITIFACSNQLRCFFWCQTCKSLPRYLVNPAPSKKCFKKLFLMDDRMTHPWGTPWFF